MPYQKRLAQNQHAPGSGGRELNGRLGFPPAARLHTLPQLAVNLQPSRHMGHEGEGAAYGHG